MLIDLSACMFYEPVLPLIKDYYEQVTSTTMASTQALYDTTIVSTASDAVLEGQPTLPADEGCALLYCAMQICLKTPVFTDMAGERTEFAMRRSEWDMAIVGDVPPEVDIIKACIGRLTSIRLLSSRMARTDAVLKGLDAVYELAKSGKV